MTLTLTDYDRRDIELFTSNVLQTLPEHFRADYPTLISFFETYYQFMDEDPTMGFAKTIHQLYKTRDVQATPGDLLDNLLNEIGAGLVRSDFFLRPRSAARLLAFLYRLKGSLYSAESFFRLFYNTTAEISYPKRNIFIVGESLLGAESLSVIQDGQLYQLYSILIKTDIPSIEWQELYKALIHPAGFYLGAEVLIVSLADLDLDVMPAAIPDSGALTIILNPELDDIISQFAVDSASIVEYSSILNIGIEGQQRIDVNKQIAVYTEMTIAQADSQYETLQQMLQYGSVTTDNTTGPDASNTVETMDQVYLDVFDSAVAFTTDQWILTTGFWNDNGQWANNNFWNDGPSWLMNDNLSWNDSGVWVDNELWIDSDFISFVL